jgi:DNA-binding GntR family transcriptional regulator
MTSAKAQIPVNILENRSLPDKAAGYIREQIIKGGFPQGSRLVEDDLSKSLGVSRACVREALLNLQKEGLVIRKRNTCTEVVRLNKQDLQEVFMLRVSLELLCAEMCMAAKAVPLDDMKKQLAVIRQKSISGRTDYIKRIHEDIKFHELIIKASRNKRAQFFWNSIKSQMMTMFYTIPEQHFDYFDLFSIENHEKIINGFESGNPEQALPVLKQHILLTLELLSIDLDKNNRMEMKT